MGGGGVEFSSMELWEGFEFSSMEFGGLGVEFSMEFGGRVLLNGVWGLSSPHWSCGGWG